MRPFQTSLLLILIAVLGLGSWWLISGGESLGGVATAIPEQEFEKTRPEKPAAELEAVKESVDEPESTRTELATIAEPEPVATERTDRKISGVVTDVLGNGIEGVRIVIAPQEGFGSMGLDLAEENAPVWIQREEGESDSEGRFSLEAPKGANLRLAARHPGFAPLDKEVSVKQTEDHDLGALALEDSAVLTGRIVDSRGRGLSEVELRALNTDDQAFVFRTGGSNAGRLVATTDENGLFRIDQLASGPYKILLAAESHPEGVETGTTERPGAQVHDLVWALPDGLTIEGRVTGVPEERFASTWVKAVPSSGLGSGITHAGQVDGVRRSELRADGSFLLTGLREGTEYRVSASEGSRRLWSPVRSDSVTAKAGDRDVMIQWRSESALVFRVVDADTGDAVEKFTVRAGIDWPQPLNGEDGEELEHHPDGRVRFGGLQAKTEGSLAELQITATGYERYEREKIELRAGEDLEIGTVRIKRVPLVRVRVVDDKTGKPIPRARVTLREQKASSGFDLSSLNLELEDDLILPGGTGDSQSGRTDKEGIATFSSLPGKVCELTAKRKGYARTKVTDTRLSADADVELEIRMRVGGTVLVTVVDTNGEPIGGAKVEHRAPGDNAMPAGMVMMSGGGGDLTDVEGKKEFKHLAAGSHSFKIGSGSGPGIVMISSGSSSAFGVNTDLGSPGEAEQEAWEHVEVVDGASAELTLIAPAKSALYGKVVESGKPLAGAKVVLQEEGGDGFGAGLIGFGNELKAKTNGKGEFRIEGVEVGKYDVIVTHPLRALPSEFGASLQEGENDMGTLDLYVCIVEGRVVNQNGDPLEGVRIEPKRPAEDAPQRTVSIQTSFVSDSGEGGEMSMTSGPGLTEAIKTDADGRYRLRGVPPNTELTIAASGPDLQEQTSEPIVLNPDEVRTGVDLTMKEGGRLTVIAEKLNGTEIGFCMVNATHLKGETPLSDPRSESLFNTTRTEFTGLAPGTWSISVVPMDFSEGQAGLSDGTEPQEVEVIVGETAEITIPLP